jgi:hypothetical protein
MEQSTLQIIGVLHGDIKSRGDAPKNFDESERVGTLEIYPEYQEGLEGIVSGQTIVVLFWLHLSGRDVLKVYPRGDKSRGVARRILHPQMTDGVRLPSWQVTPPLFPVMLAEANAGYQTVPAVSSNARIRAFRTSTLPMGIALLLRCFLAAQDCPLQFLRLSSVSSEFF